METFGKNFDFLGRADVRLPVLKNFAYQWNGVTDAKIYPVFTAVGAPGSGKTRLNLELMSFVSKFALSDDSWVKLPADDFPKIANVADFKLAFQSPLRIYTTFGNGTVVLASEYSRDVQNCEKAVAGRILFSHFNPSHCDGKMVNALTFATFLDVLGGNFPDFELTIAKAIQLCVEDKFFSAQDRHPPPPPAVAVFFGLDEFQEWLRNSDMSRSFESVVKSMVALQCSPVDVKGIRVLFTPLLSGTDVVSITDILQKSVIRRGILPLGLLSLDDCCRIAIDTFKVRQRCQTLYQHQLGQYHLNPRVKACLADTGGHPRVLEYVLQNIVELSAPSDATLVTAWNKAQSDYGNVPNYSADVICSALLGEPITRTAVGGSKTEYAELEEKGAVVLQEIGNVLICQIPFFMLSKRLTRNPNIECLKPFMHYFTTPFWAERDLTWEIFEKEVAEIEALRLSLFQSRNKPLVVNRYFPKYNNFDNEVKGLAIDLSPTEADMTYFRSVKEYPHVQSIETRTQYPKGFEGQNVSFVHAENPKSNVNFRERTFIAKNGGGAPAIDLFSGALRIFTSFERVWIILQNKHSQTKGKLTLKEITSNWATFQNTLKGFKGSPTYFIVGMISNRELADDVKEASLPENYFVVHKGNLEQYYSATFSKRFEILTS